MADAAVPATRAVVQNEPATQAGVRLRWQSKAKLDIMRRAVDSALVSKKFSLHIACEEF